MKNIRLENFRCYANQTVNFKPGINLLIGDNASGKTSLLKACKYVLSAFFSGYSDENTRWISPDIDDFRQELEGDIILPESPLKIEFTTGEGIVGTLQKNTRKNSKALVSGISDYRDIARAIQFISKIQESEDILNEVEESSSQLNSLPLFPDFSIEDVQDSDIHGSEDDLDGIEETYLPFQALPLFANFSTEDIQSTRKIDMSKFIEYAQKVSFGYYECLSGNGSLPYWTKRLLVLQEGDKNIEEITIVRNALIKALGIDGCNIINDMQIRFNQRRIYYILIDGREVETDFLSDGYRRLVNIVTDIAFRCALLNRGVYQLDACKKTRGTVLIDEIDLHLHPTLQATVLKGLHNAFPNIQFIVTTHAPMVMTGVESNEANNVCKLCYSPKEGYTVNETQTYGMDVSTITEVVLKQVPRDEKVDRDLSMLFEYIDENKTEEALALLKKMKDQFGDNLPELAQAEVMINSIAISNAKD